MKLTWKDFRKNDWWKKVPMLVSILRWAKRTSFIGFKGVPVYDVLVFIYKESLRDDITTRANSMAFSFFIALFPSFIFLFTLLPMFPTIADSAMDVRESISGLLPGASEEYLFNIIDDIVSRQRSGLLSFGLLLAVFFASNGMLAMMRGFEKVNTNTFKSRHWFKKRLIAIGLTIIIVFIFIVSSLLIVLFHVIINVIDSYTDLDDFTVLAFGGLRWLVVIMLIYSCVAVIYRYGPAIKRKFHFFSLGATIASTLIIISSLGFSYFVTNFGQYNELYGSIGALIVTLLWFNIICFILLVGFELNASIAVNRDLKIQINEKIAKENQQDYTTSATTKILPPT